MSDNQPATSQTPDTNVDVQTSKSKDILEALVKESILTSQQADDLRKRTAKSKETIEDVLIKQGVVDIEKLVKIKAAVNDVPYTNLTEKIIPRNVLEIISPEVAQNYQIICFNKSGITLEIGIIDLGNLKAREALNFFAKGAGYIVKYYLISKESFSKAFKQYSSLSEEVDVALKAREAEAEEKEIKAESEGTEEIAQAAPISKIVSVILRHAVEGHASDIHIEPYKGQSRVRYRIDGMLHTSLTLPRNVHAAVVARIKVLSSLKLDETRLPQDGRIRFDINGKRIDFRVSILPLVNDEKVVMRVLDVSQGAPKLVDLGYNKRCIDIIEKQIKKSDGLFLVTGPTGSGKSTTLFAMLNIINVEGVNISTLEDPVEYFLEGTNQAQIRTEIGFLFATGLRSLLRQDPDIIMVGEIRDNETAELAIHAALTGHMVLSTLHTNDALGSIPRLIDMKVEPFLLASTINGIIAQRLLRKICQHCKIKNEVSDDIFNYIVGEVKKIYDIASDAQKKLFDSTVLRSDGKYNALQKGKGCPRCDHTGYRGRFAISEVIDMNEEIRHIIANRKELNYDSEVLKKQHFITIQQDGIIKALEGITSIEEVLRVMSD
ncbi:MAG: GspE/PulE family protein [bacterium]|nr:GspE/PulE family protein [bacterium]